MSRAGGMSLSACGPGALPVPRSGSIDTDRQTPGPREPAVLARTAAGGGPRRSPARGGAAHRPRGSSGRAPQAPELPLADLQHATVEPLGGHVDVALPQRLAVELYPPPRLAVERDPALRQQPPRLRARAPEARGDDGRKVHGPAVLDAEGQLVDL